MHEYVSIIRIIAIVFPVLGIVLVGWAYGRNRCVDMAGSNQINMDIFIPALVFSVLADQSFELAGQQHLAMAALLMIIGSGLIGWLIAKSCGFSPKVLVPTLMFNNCGNLGLPLAVLAFGRTGLTAAVVMFLVSNLLQFSFGIWFLDHTARWNKVWRAPVIMAAVAGLAISFSGLAMWQPLQLAIKMLGDVSIPLSLFALGVRIAHSHAYDLRVGLIGAIARPLTGILLALLLAPLFGLDHQQRALLIIFGALPPAVINYVFAERYRQGPDEVAAIVLLGNIAAVAVIPLVLACVL